LSGVVVAADFSGGASSAARPMVTVPAKNANKAAKMCSRVTAVSPEAVFDITCAARIPRVAAVSRQWPLLALPTSATHFSDRK
jgi:hypothetical protein